VWNAVSLWRLLDRGRRQGSDGRGWACLDTAPTPAQSAPLPLAPLALTIVIPVYNGATSIAELVAALEELNDRPAGTRSCWSMTAAPTTAALSAAIFAERARVPITLVDLSRNYGEHNAVMAGLRHARGAHVITMDDGFAEPAEEVERLLLFAQESGHEVIYTYYDEEAARPLAQPRQPVHQLGGRVRDRQAEGLLPVELPLHEHLVAAESPDMRGPFPMSTGSSCRLPRTSTGCWFPSAARGRAQQLYDAPAVAAVAQHVRQFLGHAAAAQPLTGFALSLFGRSQPSSR